MGKMKRYVFVRDMKINQGTLRESFEILVADNILYLNGVMVDNQTKNILLDLIEKEKRNPFYLKETVL